MPTVFSKDILNNLDLHHIKLFNDHFHLKMKYLKSIGAIFYEIRHLINKIMNESSEDGINLTNLQKAFFGLDKVNLHKFN